MEFSSIGETMEGAIVEKESWERDVLDHLKNKAPHAESIPLLM